MTHRDNEARLETIFRDSVRRELGGMVLKWAPIRVGTPDRVVLLPGGRIVFVELKTLTGALSSMQRHWHRQALALGTTVIVLHGRDEIMRWVESERRLLLCAVTLVG